MLLETMTTAEVAAAKGVSEAAIRFAVRDPQNKSLLGIKCGGRLFVLASSAETYVPRNYPRMQKFIHDIDFDRNQERIKGILNDLAVNIVEEHPIAGRILLFTIPNGNIAVNGKAGYGLTLYTPDDLSIVEGKGLATIEVIFPSDNNKTVERKARQWALQLVKDEIVIEKTPGS